MDEFMSFNIEEVDSCSEDSNLEDQFRGSVSDSSNEDFDFFNSNRIETLTSETPRFEDSLDKVALNHFDSVHNKDVITNLRDPENYIKYIRNLPMFLDETKSEMIDSINL